MRPEVETRYNEQVQHALDPVGAWAADGCHNDARGASDHVETRRLHSTSEYRRRTEVPDPDDFVTSHD